MIDGMVDLDREWTWAEPSEEDGVTPVVATWTEAQILQRYWKYWSHRIRKMGGFPHPYNCVMDWVTVFWAEPNV